MIDIYFAAIMESVNRCKRFVNTLFLKYCAQNCFVAKPKDKLEDMNNPKNVQRQLIFFFQMYARVIHHHFDGVSGCQHCWDCLRLRGFPKHWGNQGTLQRRTTINAILRSS